MKYTILSILLLASIQVSSQINLMGAEVEYPTLRTDSIYIYRNNITPHKFSIFEEYPCTVLTKDETIECTCFFETQNAVYKGELYNGDRQFSYALQLKESEFGVMISNEEIEAIYIHPKQTSDQ